MSQLTKLWILDHRDSLEHAYVREIQHHFRERYHTSHLTVPVDIDGLMCGLTPVRRERDFPRAVDAMRVPMGSDRTLIVVNGRLAREDQRWAVAHEIVHAMNGDPAELPANTMYQEFAELAANAGAEELLLPYDWFTAEATRRLAEPLNTLDDLITYLDTPDAQDWASLAGVSVGILGGHLLDQNWVQRPERSVHVG